ncbi:septum formation initiator family protein [Candidatus Riflebacteria bacterium]
MTNPAKEREKILQDLKNPPKRDRTKFGIHFRTELIIALSFICCFFLSTVYLKRYFSIYELKKKKNNLKLKLEELKLENRKLVEKVRKLGTLEGVEYLARNRLGLVKPGEIIIRPIKNKKEKAGGQAEE